MKTRLFGIKKVFVTEKINLDHPVRNFMDNERIRDFSDWEEIKLTKVGSIQYEFEMTNGVKTCVTTLTFSAYDDMEIGQNQQYFLAEDIKGNRMLIGLGSDYMTVPHVEITETISNSASSGCVTEYKVTWNNRAGRIYVE